MLAGAVVDDREGGRRILRVVQHMHRPSWGPIMRLRRRYERLAIDQELTGVRGAQREQALAQLVDDVRSGLALGQRVRLQHSHAHASKRLRN